MLFRNIFFRTLVIFSVPFLVLSTKGQTNTTQASETAGGTTASIRALAVGLEDGLKTLEILDGSFQSVGQLRLRVRSYSREFSCPIVEGKIIFGVEAGVNDEGETVYKPIASTEWSPELKKICLVFIPKSFVSESEMEEPYLLRKMDMSSAEFEPGTTKIVNLSPVKTYVRFGEHKEIVEAGKVVVIPGVEEVTTANMTQLNVYFLVDDQPQNVIQTRVRYLDKIRYLIVLYPDFVNKRLGVSSIRDYGNLF